MKQSVSHGQAAMEDQNHVTARRPTAHTREYDVYATRRPDPFPRVFGYHEVFHALVIVAAACHFVAVEGVVGALR